jgi:hypothetical protein
VDYFVPYSQKYQALERLRRLPRKPVRACSIRSTIAWQVAGAKEADDEETAIGEPALALVLKLVELDRSRFRNCFCWLVGQCDVFIRRGEQLALPLFSPLDEPAVDRLSALISGWALAGLRRRTFTGRGLTFRRRNKRFPAQLTRSNRLPDSLEYPGCVGVCVACGPPLLEGLSEVVVRLLSGRALSRDFGR